MNNQDSILLKIHRTYSKDESIAYLFEVLKNKDFKIGFLKSELAELEDKVKNQKQEISRQHTKLMLIKKYFKTNFDKYKGLEMSPKQIEIIEKTIEDDK